MLSSKRRIIAVGTTLIALAVVGFVYAAWTTNGSGSGYAKAQSARPLATIDVSASTITSLFPGGNGDLLLKISNPNDYPVKVTAVAGGSGSISVDAGHSTCAASNVSLNATLATTVTLADPILVGANSESAERTLRGVVSMIPDAANACQGAVFSIPLSLSGVSNSQ